MLHLEFWFRKGIVFKFTKINWKKYYVGNHCEIHISCIICLINFEKSQVLLTLPQGTPPQALYIILADEHFASKHILLFGNTLHC